MVGDRRAGQTLAVLSALAAAVAVVAAIQHPKAVEAPGMFAVMAVTAVLLAGCIAYGMWLVARGGARRGMGVGFGLAAAACWSIEIWAGGPAHLGPAVEKATGATFAMAAVVVTVAAGISTATRASRPSDVWRAGVQAGAISGAVVYTFAVATTLLTLANLGARSDYRAQFVTTQLPSIDDFLVNDILGAAGAHLAINVVLGVVGAALGHAVLKMRRLTPNPAD